MSWSWGRCSQKRLLEPAVLQQGMCRHSVFVHCSIYPCIISNAVFSIPLSCFNLDMALLCFLDAPVSILCRHYSSFNLCLANISQQDNSEFKTVRQGYGFQKRWRKRQEAKEECHKERSRKYQEKSWSNGQKKKVSLCGSEKGLPGTCCLFFAALKSHRHIFFSELE